MHLCDTCRKTRDWENDLVVKAKIERNLQQTDENRRARCGRCRAAIKNPLFQFCAKCASGERICQHCSRPTESPEEIAARLAAQEERDRMIDLFTLSVKTYGLSTSRMLFEGLRSELGDAMVNALVTLDFQDIDYGREQRPIWKLALGQNVYLVRWCETCVLLPKRAPAIVKASACGHWTTARSPAFCPVCAAERGACEGCGAAD